MSSRVSTTSMQKQSQSAVSSNGVDERFSMQPDADKMASSGFSKNLKLLSVCTIGGMAFGIAAEKGQVHLPSVIQSQMTFSQFTMMKMFLSAVASSTIVFSLISLPITRKYFNTIRASYISGLYYHMYTKSLIGGLILGAGMSLCGSCPGMILVQIGSGTQNAVITLLGCFTGAMLYSVLDPYLPQKAAKNAHQYVNSYFNIPFHYIGVPFGLGLAGVALAIDYLYPSMTGATTGMKMNSLPEYVMSFMTLKAWNPILAGTIIGMIQLPITFAVGDTIGGSSSYCTMLSQVMGRLGLLSYTPFSYFKRFSSGLGNWWQVCYVFGAVIGGFLSASLSGSLGSAVGVSPVLAFTGGACLLFGARMAAGCTSGHGISGMGLLAIHSFIATPAIFAGGITTALLLTNYY